MSATQKCPRCGAGLTGAALEGLCPACLVGVMREVNVAPATVIVPVPAGTAPSPRPILHYFGNYELVKEIARGGMGVVFKARQVSLNRVVALKMILAGQLAGEAAVRRFRTEAEAAANLQHPNIVAIHEVGEHEGQHYFSMDYIAGRDLADLVRENPLPAARAARYVQIIAEAIHYAHGQGVLHRDLKPSNVLIDANDQPRVTDFGLAKFVVPPSGGLQGQEPAKAGTTSHLTLTGQALGTPSYMPPEQARGGRDEIGPASDVYSLGAILYHLLTGRAPFRAETPMETLVQVVGAEPVSPRLLNPSVPRDVETICLKCLEKEGRRRYRSAQALADELGRFLRHEPIHARPITTGERAIKWVKRRPVVAALMGMVILVTAIGAAGVLWQLRQTIAARHAAQQRADAEAYESYVAKVGLAAAKIDAGALDFAEELLMSCPPKLRHWEWSWLKGQCHPEIQTFVGHTEPFGIKLAALSPNGKFAATVGDPGNSAEMQLVRVWELATGRQLALLRGAGPVLTSLAFTPDSRRLAACGVSWARVWEVEGGRQLTSFANALAVSPDAQRVFVDLDDDTNPRSLRIHDTDSGREICSFETAGIHLEQAVFSPDGQRLLTEELLPSVEPAEYAKLTPAEREAASRRPARFVTKVRDAATGRQISVLRPTPGRFARAAFSPDGRFLFTVRYFTGNSAQNNVTTFWNADTGHADERFALSSRRPPAFSPDGKRMAIVQDVGHTVAIWDLAGGKSMVSLSGHSDNIQSTVFSPDGQRVLTAGDDRTARLWNGASGKQIAEFKGHWAAVNQAIFSTNGQRILTASRDGTAKLWDADPLRHQIALPAHAGKVSEAKFSPDGTRLLTVGSDFAVRLWDGETGAELHAFLYQSAVRFAEFSLDGKQVLVVAQVPETNSLNRSQSRVAHVWDSRAGKELFSLQGELVLSISRDGKHLLKIEEKAGGLETPANPGRARYAIKIHDLATRTDRELATSPVADRLIAAFSWSGKFLAAATETNCLKVFEVASGKELTSLSITSGLSRAQFAPGDAILYTEDREERGTFWETQTWRPLGAFSGNSLWDPFSSDGQFLLTGGNTNTARIWAMATGREVSVLKGHWGRISAAAFFPDGQRVMTVSDDKTAKLWDLKTGRELLTFSHAGPFVSVAVAPDGKRIVTAAGNTAIIWTAQGWETNAAGITK